MVTDFDADSISVIETSTDEVASSYLIGTKPVRGVVSADNFAHVRQQFRIE